MAVYGSTNCDASGSFTGIVTTGDGSTGFDNVNEREGVACFYADGDGAAGTAYGYLDLTTDIGDGDYFHIGGWHWFARDWDFSTPSNPVISSNQVALALHDTVNSKNIWFVQVHDGNKDAGGHSKWQVVCSIGSDSANGEPGWIRGVWRAIHIYGYVHNTAGWLQLWEDGTCWIEITGIDTYPGSDWDRLTLGFAFEGAAANDVCHVFDDFIVDDEASPAPPGTVKPWWYYQRRRAG